MLFGGRNTEEITEDALTVALSESFNKKLSSLESKALRIVSGMHSSVSELAAACEQFRKLNKDPDLEFIRASSITYVRELKDSYTNLLSRIISSHRRVNWENSATTYEKYSLYAADSEALLKEILEANTSFKMVLDAYPNDLKQLKKAFSSLESGLRMLNAELNSRAAELNEHNDLLSRINSLVSLGEELRGIRTSIEDINSQSNKRADIGKLEALEAAASSLATRKKELEMTETKLKAELSTIFGTIEKPAKKHDYLSTHKQKLAGLIGSNALLRNEQIYAELLKQLHELDSEISTGIISVKNKEEVRLAISAVKKGRLREMLEGLDEIKAKAMPLEKELADSSRLIEEIKKAMHDASKLESELCGLNEKSIKISKEREELKAAIESMFMVYYKRRIKVVLH
ncbi:MAG: hypothetical protein QXF01_00070 [Candidatus Micrarchaeaceae archaeon]